MASRKSSSVEHAAVRVKDIRWPVRLFRDAHGMPARELDADAEDIGRPGRWAGYGE